MQTVDIREFAEDAKAFLADTAGNVALIFAVAAIPILFAAGVAIDYTHFYLKSSTTQSALDTAVLAGAVVLSSGDDAAISAAEKFFATNNQNKPVQVSFKVEDGIVYGDAFFSLKTSLSGIYGYTKLEAKISSAAASASIGHGVELAIVVDVSGSMGRDIPDLRIAVTSILDQIYRGNETAPETWVSIIPFGGRVNLTNDGLSWFANGEVPGTSGAAQDTGGAFANVGTWGVTLNPDPKCKIKSYIADFPRICAARRTNSNQWSDALPGTEKFKFFEGDAEVCPVSRAQGLVNSLSVLQKVADNLCAGHGTSTQEGIAWGWRAVSPKWKGLWGDPNLPLDNESSPGKVVVIMTDGKNHPDQSDDAISVSEADAELLKTCEAMKNEGITVYAITFGMNGELSSLYQKCTTKPEYEISAENASELIGAFAGIGKNIMSGPVRLIH